MRLRGLGVAVLVAGLVLCSAVAQMATAKPPKPPATASVTIADSPNPIVYGTRTTITGQATGKKAAGATVTLYAKPAPSTTAKTVGTTTADSTGHYKFVVAPDRNTTYYVAAHTAPLATSTQVLVKVKIAITLRVSTTKPKPGARVRFSGSVLPAYNGKLVLIQRKTTRGWTTVAKAKLVAAKPVSTALGATTRSSFAKRLRISKSGTYRALFNPADGLRLASASATRKLTVR